ncbi:aminomethyltransferase family protein [Wenxinia marina]|uniref:Glycine cleavage system T protein (Aminomethyltransferase) n=1 Tax=Wenxinia marina DSM 24838 TaxID=1123501 RepID=A0A0D0Q8D8_9RHOB|nr:aminomethyltransferase family protein [Wenxinia marina]KIQ68657.1 Glycine cleavage system T protein (aminomethyltransferase) [Wenxinia marina DSM 24838]GGL67714.1 glycine cleavage system protein T [Wenxinia marina]
MPSLSDKLAGYPSAVTMLRTAPTGRYQFPIAPEFSTWIEEVRAWREAAVLFDQSVHMTDLYVSGPDTIRLISDLGINSFKGFGRNKAKQIVCCTEDGFLVGDAILFGLEDDAVNIVGRPCVPNWVQFHAETGDYDVTVERDERRLDAPDAARKTYRFEVQGPAAMAVLEAANEGGPLVTKFFNMGEITIAGRTARTLAHGMGGAQGLEIWGPAEDGPAVREALLGAGRAHGLRPAGGRAYSTANTESGWISSPLPAVYSGGSTAAYRDWLTDRSFEAACSLGGSFLSDDIADYYMTPWDLEYDRVMKFDHDFTGRAALEAMAADQPRRHKVTLVWDEESVLEVVRGAMRDGLAPKFLEWPTAHYATHPYDEVRDGDRLVGLSTSASYSANERAWLSLATVEAAQAEPGTRLTLVWGEPEGGGTRPAVEPHRQVEIGVTVQPWPIHEASRREYRRQR